MDGEMKKHVCVKAADSLFTTFRNKDKIVSAIEFMIKL